MVVKWLLGMILTVFSGIDQLVVPNLPNEVTTVLQDLWLLMRNGLSWVFSFIDRNYASILFTWWINIGALLLGVELIYSIWHVITGNAHSREAKYESSNNSTSSD